MGVAIYIVVQDQPEDLDLFVNGKAIGHARRGGIDFGEGQPLISVDNEFGVFVLADEMREVVRDARRGVVGGDCGRPEDARQGERDFWRPGTQ